LADSKNREYSSKFSFSPCKKTFFWKKNSLKISVFIFRIIFLPTLPLDYGSINKILVIFESFGIHKLVSYLILSPKQTYSTTYSSSLHKPFNVKVRKVIHSYYFLGISSEENQFSVVGKEWVRLEQLLGLINNNIYFLEIEIGWTWCFFFLVPLNKLIKFINI
jgi:hypothetical protein